MCNMWLLFGSHDSVRGSFTRVSRKKNGFFKPSQAAVQVTVTRFGLGMWQTITILQCPPRQALLSDLTVTT